MVKFSTEFGIISFECKAEYRRDLLLICSDVIDWGREREIRDSQWKKIISPICKSLIDLEKLILASVWQFEKAPSTIDKKVTDWGMSNVMSEEQA